ncbi:hypothetical protein AX27061_4405 [Achromobacter xylosoxidans NBRC 15126 = ATCC 27061]|nr:hypothetical protein AX27061_4405 [Achromobacter xylosoxidans NBRC 15126 = ATCC 27061]
MEFSFQRAVVFSGKLSFWPEFDGASRGFPCARRLHLLR